MMAALATGAHERQTAAAIAGSKQRARIMILLRGSGELGRAGNRPRAGRINRPWQRASTRPLPGRGGATSATRVKFHSQAGDGATARGGRQPGGDPALAQLLEDA